MLGMLIHHELLMIVIASVLIAIAVGLLVFLLADYLKDGIDWALTPAPTPMQPIRIEPMEVVLPMIQNDETQETQVMAAAGTDIRMTVWCVLRKDMANHEEVWYVGASRDNAEEMLREEDLLGYWWTIREHYVGQPVR